MQVSAIKNLSILSNKSLKDNGPVQEPAPAPTKEIAFGESDNRNRDVMKALRNLGVATVFLIPTASMVTSCDKEDYYGYAKAEAHAWGGPGSVIDTTICKHPTDTIIKWYYKFQRPIPLDSLFNNMDNWDIDGTDGDMNDSTSNRNIIHYEGLRDWEYDSKEIGDINLIESSKKVLVYDTELLDYKGRHEAFGKRIFRVPAGAFTIKKEDGTVLTSPKGLFVEEYENETTNKKASILDCKLKTRAFVTTNGDTLNVAKRKGTNEFVETGKVAKGYLGANSILLKNLIGEYATDEHYLDFKVEAVNDEKLRAMYVYEMDKKED